MESLGKKAVKAAREAAENETRGDGRNPALGKEFDGRSGVFVTINTYPAGHLRGCIGYPEPVLPLGEALVSAARSACHDPRFRRLSPEEAANCVFEVTILTPPERLHYSTPKELLDQIEIGRDGLIISMMGRRGLLLPQVPVEWGWDKEEYLEHLSGKANLPSDAWKDKRAAIERFGGEIYAEESPRGNVVRK